MHRNQESKIPPPSENSFADLMSSCCCCGSGLVVLRYGVSIASLTKSCFHSNFGMKPFLIFVLILQLVFVEAADGEGMSTIGAIVGSIFAIVAIFLILSLLYFCYRKYRQKEHLRHSVRYINNINSRTQVDIHSNGFAPPPSYFQSEPQRQTNHHTQINMDQPPSYSAHMSLYHTHASGQPMVSGNVMRGLDNPAFLNRSISSFSDLPNMADVLLTSSRTSIPAAVMAEGNPTKTNKTSDSARGDSIESKATSSSSQFAYVNPQFSMLFEEDEHQKPGNILNERLESSDSESELPTADMGGRWLDSIKNQQPADKSNVVQKSTVGQADKSRQRTTSKGKSINKKPPSLDKISHRPQKKRVQKMKMESSDSGAEVSSNPQGSVDQAHGFNETRLSKISSDSGLGDASTVKKSKQNPRLKWDSNNKKFSRSLSTDV